MKLHTYMSNSILCQVGRKTLTHQPTLCSVHLVFRSLLCVSLLLYFLPTTIILCVLTLSVGLDIVSLLTIMMLRCSNKRA